MSIKENGLGQVIQSNDDGCARCRQPGEGFEQRVGNGEPQASLVGEWQCAEHTQCKVVKNGNQEPVLDTHFRLVAVKDKPEEQADRKSHGKGGEKNPVLTVMEVQ